MSSSASRILDFILPPRCPVSGDIVDSQGMITPNSWKELNFIADPMCEKCGIPFDYDDEAAPTTCNKICSDCMKQPPKYGKARSALIYDDASRNLILGFKHADQTHILPAFIPWLERVGEDMLAEADIIVPVPLHPLRLLRRRYNQAALIAQYLSKATQIPVCVDALKRTRHTKTQGHLRPKERRNNINNAFQVLDKNKKTISNKKILLIDDVYTTGVTVKECIKVLLSAGASNVDVLAIARAIKHY